MFQEKNFFIDTNLIIHYLILSNLKSGVRKKYKDRYKNSFDFIKLILKNKNKSIRFFTSSLSQAEIYFGILDEYRCEKMYCDGVPLSCWTNEKWGTKLNEDETLGIKNLVLTFSDKYVYSKEDKQKKIMTLKDLYDPSLLSELVLTKKVRTHDAVILSTAISEKCDYMVTRDKNLIDSLKDYKKIEVITPEKAKEIIKL